MALSEKVPDPKLRPHGFALRVGELLDLDEAAADLVAAGYERVDQVEDRGQFAVRGGLLDVYPATEERAVRVDLFDDEIESLRWFSTFTQRSLGDADVVEIAPAAELAPEHRELAEIAALENPDERPDVAELLPVGDFRELLDLVPGPRAGDRRRRRGRRAGAARPLGGRLRRLPRHRRPPPLRQAGRHPRGARARRVACGCPRSAARSRSRSARRRPSSPRARCARPSRSWRSSCARATRPSSPGRSAAPPSAPPTTSGAPRRASRTATSSCSSSRRCATASSRPQLKLAVVPEHRLIHRRKRGRHRRRAPGRGRGLLRSFTDLRTGDIVVHEDHGIARFAGFDTKTVAGVTRDYLNLEYAGTDKVFLPVDQLAKISRYVGADGAHPPLSKLGGTRWDKIKARARRAAQELAGELLNLYAERKRRRGHAFEPDSDWLREFEEHFPYRETPDQRDAIESVKEDMESERPMDRLICGDVGYGKTEVALRAAFKAANAGKQVLMLVPTTILAQQHFGTFTERLRDYPFTIEHVSRFRPAAEQREAVKRFSEGKVDILIGTHRLLSRDVRAKDLGLLIVDEEQRFGVKQKELLRQMKLKVDVISMSATPIPRTLQMSLAGPARHQRDRDAAGGPPARQDLRRRVRRAARQAGARSARRRASGQAFFLHNRVEDIDETAVRLRALCPEHELHGRPRADGREAARGPHDALPARRGRRARLDLDHRVGHRHPAGQHADRRARGHLRPVAALPDPRPRRPLARARLRVPALSQRGRADARGGRPAVARSADYTELGAGFKVAMRDLELRGAGNLLGDEQSGHVAALGFELYMQMLDEAVQAMASDDGAEYPEPVRLDVNVDAYVPADYIPYEQAKVDVHRRIAGAREVVRADGAAARARRPLRRAARAAGEPDHAPAGAHQARRGGRPRGHVPAGPARGDADRARLRARPQAARGDPRTRSTSRASRSSRCGSPTTPPSASRRSCGRPTRCSPSSATPPDAV